jgi:hypothetical protein
MSTLTINNFEHTIAEQAFLTACLKKAASFKASSVALSTASRLASGWIEWSLMLTFENHCLFIACIQRKPHADYEFCT